MLIDYSLWSLHRVINEANDIINNLNRQIARNRSLFFEDETGGATLTPGLPTKTKLSVKEALNTIPALGYLDQYINPRGMVSKGAQWFINESRKRNPRGNAEKEGIRECILSHYKEEAKIQGAHGGIRNPAGVVINKINHRVFNYDVVQDAISKLIENEELDCCDAITVRMRLKEKLFQAAEVVIDMLNYPLKLVGNDQVQKEELHSRNYGFFERDMRYLKDEKVKTDCGDCGGFKASQRWQPTTPSPKPANRLPPRGTSRIGNKGGRRY